MPGQKRTPSINLKGRYTFISPFVTNASFQYTCIAIRSFQDVIERDGEEVFATYYDPVGISDTDYFTDVGLKANIITLLRSDNTFLYIPDTYIESYPAMDSITYKHVVMGISMGPIPDYVNLDALKDLIQGNVSDIIGVAGEVVTTVAPHTGSISPVEHESLEVTRTAAITLRETLYSENYVLQSRLNDALARIALLEQILIDNNLIT